MEILNTLSDYFMNLPQFEGGSKQIILRAYNACKGLIDEDLTGFLFALYYFCSDYHSGQNSHLYQISSCMRIKTNKNIHNEDESIQSIYSALEAEFGHETTF